MIRVPNKHMHTSHTFVHALCDTHTHIPCEIPLAGRARCLSGAGLHHAPQQLYIEVIIVGFQAPSSVFPLFCINRTSGFSFPKVPFWPGSPSSLLSLKRLQTCFILLQCWEEHRQTDRQTVCLDYKMIKTSRLSHHASTDDTTNIPAC